MQQANVTCIRANPLTSTYTLGSIYVVGDFEPISQRVEGLLTLPESIPHFCPTGYVIFRQRDCHWPPSWSYTTVLNGYRLEGFYTGATETSQAQRAVSATIRVS